MPIEKDVHIAANNINRLHWKKVSFNRTYLSVAICKRKKKFYESTNSGGMKVKFEIENLKILEKYDGCSNLPTSYDE